MKWCRTHARAYETCRVHADLAEARELLKYVVDSCYAYTGVKAPTYASYWFGQLWRRAEAYLQRTAGGL
jgi:hypothetical protein